MKNWIKDGLIGGIIVVILYLVVNLIFVFSGNPKYQSLVDMNYFYNFNNILTIIILFVIGGVVGIIISLMAGKMRAKSKEKRKSLLKLRGALR